MDDQERKAKERTAGIFSRAASTYDRIGPRFLSHYGHRLVALAHIPRGATVLDVATGRGAVLFPAAEQVGARGRAVGVDLSTGMLRETAREIRGSSLGHAQICQMDAENLALAEASFDFALCGHSIFFFPQAVHEFYRVLRPGGQAGMTIITQGCFDWLWDAFRAHAPSQENGALEEREDASPAIDTPAGLELTLREGGFEKIRVTEEADDFVYVDEEQFWSSLWTLGFRGALESMTPTPLAKLKADIYHRLQKHKKPDGVHLLFRVLFAFGTKP